MDAARQHVDNSGHDDNPREDDVLRTIAAWQRQGLTAAQAYEALTGQHIGWGTVHALMLRLA